MIYQDLSPITRQQAEQLLGQPLSEKETAEILMRLSISADEGVWKQNLIEIYLKSKSEVLQYAAIRALGNLARVESRSFDQERASNALQAFKEHSTLSGVAEDTEDDIKVYTRR
jgi:hypothetical protein